jgi:hypothetical protein
MRGIGRMSKMSGGRRTGIEVGELPTGLTRLTLVFETLYSSTCFVSSSSSSSSSFWIRQYLYIGYGTR